MKLGLLIAFLTLTSCTEYREEKEIKDNESAFFVAGMEPVPLFSEPRDDSTVLLSLKPGTNLRADLSLMIEPRFFGDQKQWIHILEVRRDDLFDQTDVYSGSAGWIRRTDVESGSLGMSLDENSYHDGPYRIRVFRAKCPFPDFQRCLHFTGAGYPYADCYVGRKYTVVFAGGIGVRRTAQGPVQCELHAQEWVLATAGTIIHFDDHRMAVLQGDHRIRHSKKDRRQARIVVWNLEPPARIREIELPDPPRESFLDVAMARLDFEYETDCPQKTANHQEWKRCVDAELIEAGLPFSVPAQEECAGRARYVFYVRPLLDSQEFKYTDATFECR